MPVEVTPEAAEELDRLPLVIHARVTEIIERLERWPTVPGDNPLVRDRREIFASAPAHIASSSVCRDSG
ncbi:MAG TPA: hypothetical protein VLI90_13640 [Tepidisphaeraceae bacterium]|nr:hypothetical protein [Tepidisphaeraceae bacterium]